jgi:hypothetical protein
VKVLALLSWYDEPSPWLAAVVSSCAPFCDGIVAVDGAYWLFPESDPRSSPVQAQTVFETATACGLSCTIHSPSEHFYGNEVEKRTLLFRLAEPLGADWYFVIDGDEVVVAHPADLREKLEATDKDAGLVTLHESLDHLGPTASFEPFAGKVRGHPHRAFFRALPNLRVEGAHYRYLAERDGETVCLWGQGESACEPARFLGVRVEHRQRMRSLARRQQAERYYELRDRLGVESLVADTPA